MSCKNCDKELVQTEGKRERKYCNDACKMSYHRNKSNVTDHTVTPVTLRLSTTDNPREPESDKNVGNRVLTDEDMQSLPHGVSKPTCRSWEPIDISCERLHHKLGSMRMNWQSSPEYAERIYRLVRGLTDYNLPAWISSKRKVS